MAHRRQQSHQRGENPEPVTFSKPLRPRRRTGRRRRPPGGPAAKTRRARTSRTPARPSAVSVRHRSGASRPNGPGRRSAAQPRRHGQNAEDEPHRRQDVEGRGGPRRGPDPRHRGGEQLDGGGVEHHQTCTARRRPRRRSRRAMRSGRPDAQEAWRRCPAPADWPRRWRDRAARVSPSRLARGSRRRRRGRNPRERASPAQTAAGAAPPARRTTDRSPPPCERHSVRGAAGSRQRCGGHRLRPPGPARAKKQRRRRHPRPDPQSWSCPTATSLFSPEAGESPCRNYE
jgi:hypothetical protein